ncbi:DUF1758 domain containing protein [Trichuris trichiura]|uniref:DUF1758 domain containing protein n=1 Tax=Trichuris trichiura TaxID=36087 RepID=A0A077ZMW4_TRITR|nr:DUF1758 domain containing protein [Trichuris trichiura]
MRRETHLVCGKTHPVSLCPTFIATPVEQRWKNCKETRLCFRCLRAGHLAKLCKSDDGCTRQGYGRDHHELFHREKNAEGIQVGMLHSPKQTAVMLQMVQARLYGANGASVIVTCLFDAGSQRSFICKRIADNMRLQGNTECVTIHAFGSRLAKPTRCRRVAFTLRPIFTGDSYQQMEASCVPKICSVLKSNDAILESWSHVQGLTLAAKFPRSSVR